MTHEPPREIAVVDDDDAVLDSFRFMLEMAGFPVATYASASAFLARGAARTRCLILDHNMPAMTGLELTARLRAEGSNLPVLLVTAAVSPGIINRAAEVGIQRVLEKPPAERDLIEFVKASA